MSPAGDGFRPPLGRPHRGEGGRPDRVLPTGRRIDLVGSAVLGAGLDTRPYRLDLPANLDWYEVDRQDVFAPRCRRHVGVARSRFRPGGTHGGTRFSRDGALPGLVRGQRRAPPFGTDDPIALFVTGGWQAEHVTAPGAPGRTYLVTARF
jgi:hypothetical protein